MDSDLPLLLGSQAVLVPVKAFARAKERLGPTLTPAERSALARSMATTVVGAAAPLPVAVVCDDVEVAQWARGLGALVVWEPGRGLNGAVEAGVARLAQVGVARVTVAHGDLPLAENLVSLGAFDGITLVPDRAGDGTNVISLPTGTGFRFSYGPGSFSRHRAEAERVGLPVRVLHDEGLASDVDVPGDLAFTSGRGPSGLPVGDLPEHGPPTTNLPTPEVALAIGAHPDDVEFGCGATFAKWAADGCRVCHLVLTDGSKGTWEPDQDLAALVTARQDEQRAAARILGGSPGDVAFVGFVDGELDAGMAGRREVARWIRSLRPDVVLGHDPWRRYRLHPDHRSAGFLAVDGLVAARDHHFFPDLGLPAHRPSTLLLWEPDEVNHVEEVPPAAADAKVDALLAHRTQLLPTMGIDDGGVAPEAVRADLAARIGRQLAGHGSRGRFGAGEAFHRIDAL